MERLGCPECSCANCIARLKRKIDPSIPDNISSSVDAMLTDFYQVSMAYAYYTSGKMDEHAVFDAFYRKCPFSGAFCIVAGIEECIRFVNAFGFTPDQVDYLREQLPEADPGFFDYMSKIDASEVQVWAMREGDVVFPREPVISISGPLIVTQLLETTILNLINYPCLVATCAARHRRAARELTNEPTSKSDSAVDRRLSQMYYGRSPDTSQVRDPPVLLEFGCRRAQGPDGAMSASRYAYLGGFDGSSNVKAGHLFGIPIKGTHAHAYVTSFSGLEDLSKYPNMSRSLGKLDDFVERVLEYRTQVEFARTAHEGELVAFIRYAQAFPTGTLALVDTYDTLRSGVPNFLCVALAMDDAGLAPVGVRLDSGDLAYLSLQVRRMFEEHAARMDRPFIHKLKIAASNDINEDVLNSLNENGHSVDIFGIGTNLVTCQKQPALGMVYKLTELNGRPCMKLSEIKEKVSLPSRKQIYRLYSSDGVPILDLLQSVTEAAPEVGHKIYCRHIFDDSKRCYVVPSKIDRLLHHMWDGKNGTPDGCRKTLQESRDFSRDRVGELRADHLRPVNPTPYKISVSNDYFEFFRNMWHENAPVRELS